MRSRPTVLITCLVALAISTGVGGCASGNGLDTKSEEYRGGWSAADLQFARMPEGYTLGQKVQQCNKTLKQDSVRQTEFPLSQVPEGYSEHQRQLWAHGCLDYLRDGNDVPAQAWEG
jgi:hypothetical protein